MQNIKKYYQSFNKLKKFNRTKKNLLTSIFSLTKINKPHRCTKLLPIYTSKLSSLVPLLF